VSLHVCAKCGTPVEVSDFGELMIELGEKLTGHVIVVHCLACATELIRKDQRDSEAIEAPEVSTSRSRGARLAEPPGRDDRGKP